MHSIIKVKSKLNVSTLHDIWFGTAAKQDRHCLQWIGL